VEKVGCNQDASKEEVISEAWLINNRHLEWKVLKCLQEAKLEDVMEATRMFERYMFNPLSWRPIVDGEYNDIDPFLPEHPMHLIEDRKYNRVPLIMGGNRDEGNIFLPQFLNDDEKMNFVNDNWKRELAIIFMGLDDDLADNLDPSAERALYDAFTFYTVKNIIN